MWLHYRAEFPADAGDERLRMKKILSVAAIVLGLVLLAGAAVVRWSVAPSQAVLPSDTNTTTTYTGTAATLLNVNALHVPSAQALLANVPITTTHTTKVLATKGSNALVSDGGKLKVNGSAVAGYEYRYAVNRTSMDRGSGYPNVVQQRGVTFNWPIRTAKHDYKGWVSDTQSTTRLHYAGTATRGGLPTYVFTTTASPAPITDPATLKQLPQSLPKATVLELSAALKLTPSQQALFAKILPNLSDPVPFSYSYTMKATYWVAPQSGEVVDLHETETRILSLKVGSAFIPVSPVMDITYSAAADQLATSVKKARHDGNLVNLVYVTLPRGLAIAGLVLLVAGGAGLALSRRRRDADGSPTEADPESELQPV
jgi:DUF3068 family protein